MAGGRPVSARFAIRGLQERDRVKSVAFGV